MSPTCETSAKSSDFEEFNRYVGDFSGEYAEQYVARRPAYPTELFDWLVANSPGTGHAWDAGTGTGELARPLADRFTVVTASDNNTDMLGEARQADNLSYHEWPSESPQLADGSVDLITAGMAAHWFSLDRFYPTCERVLRPGGLLAILGFYFFDIDDGIGELVSDWYHREMTGYEFPQLTMLRRHYVDFDFPFPVLDGLDFTMTASWSHAQLANFLRQWIVVKRAREAGVDALAELLPAIAERWPGDVNRGLDTEVEVRWPLFGRVARFPS